MNKIELENRLISFAVLVVEIDKILPGTRAGIHLGNQLLRSGTSAALNYGEAQSGESRKDFIHKVKIALKELRESLVCLKIIYKSNLLKPSDILMSAMRENNELISIFVKSIETAQKNHYEELKNKNIRL